MKKIPDFQMITFAGKITGHIYRNKKRPVSQHFSTAFNVLHTFKVFGQTSTLQQRMAARGFYPDGSGNYRKPVVHIVGGFPVGFSKKDFPCLPPNVRVEIKAKIDNTLSKIFPNPQQLKRPPLGVKPEFIFKDELVEVIDALKRERIKTLKEAINRYADHYGPGYTMISCVLQWQKEIDDLELSIN